MERNVRYGAANTKYDPPPETDQSIMRITIDVKLDYTLSEEETVLLTLEAAQTDGQTVLEAGLEVNAVDQHRITGESGVGGRVCAVVTGGKLNLRYHASVQVSRDDTVLEQLAQMPLESLPPQVLTYLRPSRFCQSDLFTPFVQRQFGHLDGGAKIAAMRDWVASGLAYVIGSSNAATTAIDTFVAREGVCRDFTHLLCSFARAAGIPARYTSVYGADVQPPDFHAVAQVWLDGDWHIVDATGMGRAGALVVIACGRDAADVAFMETTWNATPVVQNIRVIQA
ncbi:transglutaminase-like domain-containing protein [Roseinatronobacter sp. NSM]|uniref:transglutaminase-like domain-containing protein n=1 Tax=Roseinatronobacter sp. NSM TaxID=3457785 RepID=UPI00403529CF